MQEAISELPTYEADDPTFGREEEGHLNFLLLNGNARRSFQLKLEEGISIQVSIIVAAHCSLCFGSS